MASEDWAAAVLQSACRGHLDRDSHRGRGIRERRAPPPLPTHGPPSVRGRTFGRVSSRFGHRRTHVVANPRAVSTEELRGRFTVTFTETGDLGMRFDPMIYATVTAVAKGGQAEQLGVTPGMTLVAVERRSLAREDMVQLLLDTMDARPLTVSFEVGLPVHVHVTKADIFLEKRHNAVHKNPTSYLTLEWQGRVLWKSKKRHNTSSPEFSDENNGVSLLICEAVLSDAAHISIYAHHNVRKTKLLGTAEVRLPDLYKQHQSALNGEHIIPINHNGRLVGNVYVSINVPDALVEATQRYITRTSTLTLSNPLDEIQELDLEALTNAAGLLTDSITQMAAGKDVQPTFITELFNELSNGAATLSLQDLDAALAGGAKQGKATELVDTLRDPAAGTQDGQDTSDHVTVDSLAELIYSGALDLEDFTASSFREVTREAWVTFEALDLDKTGELSMKELRFIFVPVGGEALSEEEASELMDRVFSTRGPIGLRDYAKGFQLKLWHFAPSKKPQAEMSFYLHGSPYVGCQCVIVAMNLDDGVSKWIKIRPNGTASVIHDGPSYEVRPSDLGCVLRVEFTPNLGDGLMGETVTAETETMSLDPQMLQEVTRAVRQGATFALTNATTGRPVTLKFKSGSFTMKCDGKVIAEGRMNREDQLCRLSPEERRLEISNPSYGMYAVDCRTTHQRNTVYFAFMLAKHR